MHWHPRRAGAAVVVWHPADLAAGRIAATLAGLAGEAAITSAGSDPDPEAAFWQAIYGRR